MRKVLWAALIGSLALWGLTFPLMKMALVEAEPLTMALVRFAITFPFMLAFAWALPGRGPLLSRAATRDATLIAVFALVLANVFQNYGLRHTTAGMASILQEMAPLFTIFLAVALLGERVNGYIVAGALLAFAGTVLLFYDPGMGRSALLGNALMVLTALMYAASGIIGKRALATIHPGTLTVTVHLIGLVLLGPITVAVEPQGVAEVPRWSTATWTTIAVLAIFPTALGPLVWYYALRERSLSSMSILTYLIPMFAIFFDLMLTGTVMPAASLVFGIVLVTGVVVAQHGSQVAADEHGQHF